MVSIHLWDRKLISKLISITLGDSLDLGVGGACGGSLMGKITMRASQKDGYKKLDLWVATAVRGSVPEKRETELLIK